MLLWWANQEHVLPESIAVFKCTREAAASEMSICCWLIIIIIVIKKVKFTIIFISYIKFVIFIFYIDWYCQFSIVISYLCMLNNFFSYWKVSEYRNCHVDCSCKQYCDVFTASAGWTLIRTAPNHDPLVSKWWDNTFIQVCSDGKTNLQLGFPEVSTF